jgi:hypothetical protein
MRLWTLHPSHLDSRGLVALWREALLAQAVLLGRTRGYTRHPQLLRFSSAADPGAAIGTYLRGVAGEARVRGYRFDESRIASAGEHRRLSATSGQLAYEWVHLKAKVRERDPAWFRARCRGLAPSPHPLFAIRAGGVASWERPIR